MSQDQPRIAAFFDIDGTLVPDPPLETRMFQQLRRGGEIPPMNYARWGAEAARLLPRGLTAIAQGNKRYLHGLRMEQRAARCLATRTNERFGRHATTEGRFGLHSHERIRQFGPMLAPVRGNESLEY